MAAWRANKEEEIARLKAAALKQLPPEEVKLRQQIADLEKKLEHYEQLKASELKQQIAVKDADTKADNLLFRLDACLKIAQVMQARPLPNSVLDRAFTEIARYADLDNNI